MKKVILLLLFTMSLFGYLNEDYNDNGGLGDEFTWSINSPIDSLRNISGVNPTPTELNNYILKKSKETNIPPIVVKAILLKEGQPRYKWKQYSPDSGYDHDTIVYHPDGGDSYGLGLFQITYHLNSSSINSDEVRKVVSSWKYNVDKAYDKLLAKWKSSIYGNGDDSNPLIIENWYYPIAWYNGSGTAAKSYVDYVYNYMRYEYKVESALSGSDNYDNILSKYKFIPEISTPYIIDTFNVGNNGISTHPRGNATYTLQQIVNSGGKLHIWNKSSNTYEEYTLGSTVGNQNTDIKPNLVKGGYYTYNSNPFYPKFHGQCTSFVWGRAKEKLGIELKFTNEYGQEVRSGRDAKNWLKLIHNFPHDNDIKGNSIAVWGGDTYNAHGHVAFIEKVENGKVYFNEANWKTFKNDGRTQGGGYDGNVKIWTVEKFKKYRKHAGYISGYIHLTSNNANNGSIIDGAGSIIKPDKNGYGLNKDIASMHAHDPYNSTVVFQWKNGYSSCSQLDIGTLKDNTNGSNYIKGDNLGKAIVTVRSWNSAFPNTQNDEIFEVNLDKEPFSIEKASGGSGWTLISITTKNPISNEPKNGHYIYATCSKDNFKYKDRKTLYYNDSNKGDNKLVYLTNNYWWAGNGSLISYLKTSYDYRGFGSDKDSVITYSSHKSINLFQWYVSDKCKKLKIGVQKGWKISNENISTNGINIKSWNDKNWNSKNYCNGKLPCTVDGLNNGYYIIKVKTNADAVSKYDDSKGHIMAQCIE